MLFITCLCLHGWTVSSSRVRTVMLFVPVAQNPAQSWNLSNDCQTNERDDLNLVQDQKPPHMHSCLPQVPTLNENDLTVRSPDHGLKNPGTMSDMRRRTELRKSFLHCCNFSVLFHTLPSSFFLCSSHLWGRVRRHTGRWGCVLRLFPPGALCFGGVKLLIAHTNTWIYNI